MADKPSKDVMKEFDTKQGLDPELVKLMMQLNKETVKDLAEVLIPILNKSQSEPVAYAPKTMSEQRSQTLTEINREFQRKQEENARFMRELSEAPKKDFVRYSIPLIYKKHVGSVLPVGLNGSVITFPVDGRPHPIHKAFVLHIEQKLRYIDEQVAFMDNNNNSDVREINYADLGQ